MSDARAAITEIMAQYENLTSNGFESPGSKNFDANRADLLHPNGLEYFETARAWLSAIPRRAIPNQECGDSYFLKHAVERQRGAYVSNGAMIAAAIHLGLPVKQCPSFINAWIGVASRRKWPGYQGQGGKRVQFSRAFRWRSQHITSLS